MTGFLDTGFGASGIDVGDIGHSLRFRGAQYIATAFTTAATSTFFAVIKRSKLGAISPIFDTNIKFNANDTLTAFGLTTTAVFRDPTAWIFIHISNNGLYINGVSFGAVTTSAITNPRIGFDGTNYFNGYMARVGVVSGTSAYTNFVSLDTTINEWVTKTISTVAAEVNAGGASGCLYDFNDATSLTTLGNDYSAKNNDGTLTGGFSLTAGTTYDHMLDVPGNSFVVLNPLDQYLGTVSDGNLKMAGVTAPFPAVRGSVAVSSGKWVFEWRISTASGTNATYCGFAEVNKAPSSIGTAPTLDVGYYSFNGNKRINGTASAYGATYNDANTIRCELDLDNLQAEFFKDGVSQGVITGISAGSYAPYYTDVSSTGANAVTFSFGQAPLHASATYRSAAGGYFRDEPTAGFKALCQANLPTPAILNPKLHMDIKTRTGTAATYSVTGIGFQPDLVWSKSRGRAVDHALYDSVRGVQKQLESNQTGAETTEATGLTAFNSDGYTGGALDQINGTTATNSFVDWLWKMGGTAVSNTNGSITSSVSANTLAGQSVVTYTGTGANATVGHGLLAAPELVIVKRRNLTGSWAVQSIKLTSAAYYLLLDSTGAQTTDATVWNSTAPTTTVFSLGSNGTVNGLYTYVALCFHSVAGYSKVFSYTGNGSADGPYVPCGFKPKYVLVKSSTSVTDWCAHDSAREPYNSTVRRELFPNLPAIESSDAFPTDLLADGFKVRNTGNGWNTSGQTYIGIAFADVAGKYSLGR